MITSLRRGLRAALLALGLSAGIAAAAPTVELQTTQGKIVLELDAARAPKTVSNFLAYAKDGFYDGTIFHRVIPDFMIQGGGFDKNMGEKAPRAPIENEAKNGLKNQRGTIAMARRGDPHSATAQFFINHRDNPRLDYPGHDGWGYAVFAKVVAGTDVVDKIKGVSTTMKSGHQDVPAEDVIIEKAEIIE